MVQTGDRIKSGTSGASFAMVAAILLTIVIHASFLLFKKAPESKKVNSTTPPMVALLPLNSKSATDTALLKWMDILDPQYFIKPNRACGFSLRLGDYIVDDISFVPNSRKPHFRFSSTSPLPIPTESEQESLRKLWSLSPLPLTPVEPSLEISKSEYPLWLLDDNSRLPQLFQNPEKIRNELKIQPPPRDETVMKAWFFEGDFFPKIILEHSCGDSKLDAAAIKTLTFRGSNLGIKAKADESHLFISVKWLPTNLR